MADGAENTGGRPGTAAVGTALADAADHYIPIRKVDIIDTLLNAGGPAGADSTREFRALTHMLACVFHFEYFERLEALRDAYYYLNPFITGQPALTPEQFRQRYNDLMEQFLPVLQGANFVEVTQEEIQRAHEEQGAVGVKVHTPMDGFHDLRFFRRGRHHETRKDKKFFGLLKREREIDVFDDVILVAAVKPDGENSGETLAADERTVMRPGSVLIKYFRNIPCADVNTLFPNVRVVMSLLDKLLLGVPAVAGGIPLLLKLGPALIVLILFAGYYLGLDTGSGHENLSEALAALVGIFTVGGFCMQQWMKYERKALKYQKVLSDNVYFRNVNNNAGTFDFMIGMAEEQECKEAILAYYFLLTAGTPLTEAELDHRIEVWLKERFGHAIDFEVHDGLAKLQRLELLDASDEGLSVIPINEALRRLDSAWDNYFTYSADQAA